MRFLRLCAAAAAAALILGPAALAAPPNRDSGKGNAPHATPPSRPGPHSKPGPPSSGAECPPGLHCDFVPAAYAQNSADPGDYGNYDLANRPADGLAIRFVVIHDTEESFADTLATFENSHSYVSAHYVTRSSDGHVTQMVPTKDVAWQAGNWWINTHSVGIENEGFALDPSYFTPQLYHSLARLTRYTAQRYGIPLDREHIIGHDQVPGPTAAYQAGMHWDPGTFFDWAHFMALVGAPITPKHADKTGRIVTIDPNFRTNEPSVSECNGSTVTPLSAQPANFVYLHTAPSESAPLVKDAGLHDDGSASTTQVWDIGARAAAGHKLEVAQRRGDWLGVWWLGEVAWLHNPEEDPVVLPSQWTVVEAAGDKAVPVYGRAYPESSAYPSEIPDQGVVPLQYTIKPGQSYVLADATVPTDFYYAKTYDDSLAGDHTVVRGKDVYYEIWFGHRMAYVRAADVRLLDG